MLYMTSTESEIIGDVLDELCRAETKYPDWPTDLIHQVAIMQEESGEAIRAALNHVYHGEPIEDVRAELVQTAAMCLRCLKNLER